MLQHLAGRIRTSLSDKVSGLKGHHRVLLCCVVCPAAVIGDFGAVGAAYCVSAARSCGGSALPRRSARLRIPAHAFAESQYLGGINPSGSSTEDKDTATALWHPKVLSVQYPPCGDSGRATCDTCAFPAELASAVGVNSSVCEKIGANKGAEDCGKIPSVVRGKRSENIFPETVRRVRFVPQAHLLKEQARTGARIFRHPRPLTSNGQVLARRIARQERHGADLLARQLRDITEQRRIGPAVGKDSARELLNLGVSRTLPASGFQPQTHPARASEKLKEGVRHYALRLAPRASQPRTSAFGRCPLRILRIVSSPIVA